MAAYAALVSLYNTIEQTKIHPRLFDSFDKHQIESLTTTINFLLDFVESTSMEELESQIASVAHEAEDAIESLIFLQIVHQSDLQRPRYLFLSQELTLRMDSIKRDVIKVKEERGFNDQKPTNSIPAAALATSVVGFGDELSQLLDVLIGLDSKRKIVSIVGMGGAGKTTLAKHVYEYHLIMHHFELRAWATISQSYDVIDILSQLNGKFTEERAYELGGNSNEENAYELGGNSNENAYKLGERLYRSLSGRRYLLVLDDMWSVDVWNKVKFFFHENNNGSRVVLTTRLLNVATLMKSFCVRINFLNEHDSWILFNQEVFGEEICPPKLAEIGKKIAKECKGLPLSIVVIGGLLRKSSRTEEYWRSISTNINAICSSKENGQCLDALYLSYLHLPAHLKPCFLYMGTYPEDSIIFASNIVKLWVAEGFLKPNGVQMLEEIGEDYLEDLVGRNLIIVCKSRVNGKIKSFRIHDLLRELCLSLADKELFFSVVRQPRRKYFPCSLEPQLLNVDLRHLVYMSWTSWLELPSSIHLIWNLQTIVIGAINRVIVAPLEIWNMPQLRHIKCSLILLPDPPPSDEDNSVVLGNLQTLRVVTNFRLIEEVCRRIPNIKKLRIAFDYSWEGYESNLFEYLQKNLGCLSKLESLNIWCSWITLIPIKVLKNALPRSLHKLSLSGCSLLWEDLSLVIGSLPHLEVLKLKDISSGVNKWSCVEGGFFRLKLLEIRSCALECWTLESYSCFPSMKELVLNDLWNLNEISPSIGEIPALERIIFGCCTCEVVISAMKIQKEVAEIYGKEDLQIVARMLRAKVGWFMERVEMEGLLVYNIDLVIY